MIAAQGRLPEAEKLIRGEAYFVVHAARQSGKTTCLKDIVRRLQAEGKYYALYCSLEGLQGIGEAKEGIPEVVEVVKNSLCDGGIPGWAEFGVGIKDQGHYASMLQASLKAYCRGLDKGLVVMFDEADCLSEGTLVSFLRQVRNGYIDRDEVPFPVSLAVVGMRDLRDYRAQVRPDGESRGVASPFNIVADTLTLKNFTEEEIGELYGQHTGDTGQEFEAGVAELVHGQTDGQPWLVNAIAREVIEKMLGEDYSKAVTCELVREAIQRIILARPVHLDSLMERLKEARVRRVLEPVIIGEGGIVRSDEDYLYARDLGLVKEGVGKRVEPGNAIYAEVIGRFLSEEAQMLLGVENSRAQGWKFIKEGVLDMDYLLEEFRVVWRENSEIWEERREDGFVALREYKEAVPHLVLFAFLQRVINGGGQIMREMATGKGRLDIGVVYGGQKYPIELKVCRERDKLETIIKEGLEQTGRYMDVLGSARGWLLVFDRHAGLSWDERQWRREEKTARGGEIVVLGS
jgi:hypothetical protein